MGEAPGLLSGVHPHLKLGSWGSFGGLPQSGGCPGTGWGTRRPLLRRCAEGILRTPGPGADPLPGSETHALGIPDTSLSGRSTRTALSVRRSNSVPTVAKMLEERSQNGKQGRFQGQDQTDGQGCLGLMLSFTSWVTTGRGCYIARPQFRHLCYVVTGLPG